MVTLGYISDHSPYCTVRLPDFFFFFNADKCRGNNSHHSSQSHSAPRGTRGKEVELRWGGRNGPPGRLSFQPRPPFRSRLPACPSPLECSSSSPQTCGEAPTIETQETWVEARPGPPSHLTLTGNAPQSLWLIWLCCRSRRRVPHLQTARPVPFPLTHATANQQSDRGRGSRILECCRGGFLV